MDGPAERKAAFLHKIQPLVRPGDVLTFEPTIPWYEIHLRMAQLAIQREQRALFGESARWHDIHAMLYLGPERVLSVEPIRARWARLQDFEDDRFAVFRYTKCPIGAAELSALDEAAALFAGHAFEVERILQRSTQCLGYREVHRPRRLDLAVYCRMSAVAVRACFEHMRKRAGTSGPPRLFSKFHFESWLRRPEITAGNIECRGVDLEATTPAHFANSADFDGEFERAAEFSDGRQIFPTPTPEPAPSPAAHDQGHAHRQGHAHNHGHAH